MKTIKEKIYIAAEEILMEGQWPTVLNIRERLGTGSNTTINNELKSWKNDFLESIRKLKHRPSCPDVLTNATDKIWAMACEEAEHFFKESKNELLERENQLKEIIKKLEEDHKESDSLIKQKEELIKNLKKESQELLFSLEKENSLRKTNQFKINKLETEVASEKIKLKNTIDFYQEQISELKKEENIKIEKLKTELQQREDTAYERLEGLRLHVYAQIESERKIFFEEKSSLEKMIIKLEKKNDDLTKNINSLTYEKGVLEAENKILQKELNKGKKFKFILNRKKNEI